MERVLIVVVIIVLIIGLGYYTDAKKMVRDAMETGNAEPKKEEKKEVQGAPVAAAPALRLVRSVGVLGYPAKAYVR